MPPSALESSENSECFNKNHTKSYTKDTKIPNTRILNIVLVILSELNMMYKAVVQIVRLTMSDLLSMMRIVRPL